MNADIHQIVYGYATGGIILFFFLIGILVGVMLMGWKTKKELGADIPASYHDGVYTAKVKMRTRGMRVRNIELVPNTTDGPWPF